MTEINSLEDYYSTLSAEQRSELLRVKKVALGVEPKAEEVLSYGIPTLDYNGKHLIHYAAFRNHYSVFPGPETIQKLKVKLAGFEISKGTIKYTKENYLSDELIVELVKNRLENITRQG